MAKKDSGLEKWRQRVESAEAEAPEQKPIEEMSDQELEEALAATKRELLDAQRAELRASQESQSAEEGRRFWEFKRRPYYR